MDMCYYPYTNINRTTEVSDSESGESEEAIGSEDDDGYSSESESVDPLHALHYLSQPMDCATIYIINTDNDAVTMSTQACIPMELCGTTDEFSKVARKYKYICNI